MKLRFHLTAILILLLPGFASARVWQAAGKFQGRMNPTGLSWTKAYQTRMNVNGRRSDLVMYTARYTEPVVEQIKQQLEMQGAEVKLSRSAQGAVGHARWSDSEAKFMVISSPSQPTHFIFFTYPNRSLLQSLPKLRVPEYVNGELRNIVEDEETQTVYASFDTHDTASEVHVYYGRTLPAKGWELVVPAVFRYGQAKGVSVYQKNNSLCYIQVTERSGEPSLLSILVKGGGL